MPTSLRFLTLAAALTIGGTGRVSSCAEIHRSAVAALLVAAHRRVAARPARIHLDSSRADALGDRKARREVVGVNAAGEAERAVVGDGDGLIDVTIAEHRKDGAEQLTPGRWVRRIWCVEDSRLVEPAAGLQRRSTTARHQTGPGRRRFGDNSVHSVALRLADERTDQSGWVGWVADRQSRRHGRNGFDDVRAPVLEDQQACLERAALTRVGDEHRHRRRHHIAEAAVGKRRWS